MQACRNKWQLVLAATHSTLCPSHVSIPKNQNGTRAKVACSREKIVDNKMYSKLPVGDLKWLSGNCVPA